MKYTLRQTEPYRIVSIDDDLTLSSDISDLKQVVDSSLSLGVKHFAFRFTPDSYLSTRTIAVLVTCLENIKDHKGRLVMIAPNEDIAEVLGMIDLDKVVTFCNSEEELLAKATPVAA